MSSFFIRNNRKISYQSHNSTISNNMYTITETIKFAGLGIEKSKIDSISFLISNTSDSYSVLDSKVVNRSNGFKTVSLSIQSSFLITSRLHQTPPYRLLVHATLLRYLMFLRYLLNPLTSPSLFVWLFETVFKA